MVAERGLQNLQELDVSSVRVKNLEGLSYLTNIIRLDLGPIVGDQDLSALATMTSLVDLKLNGLASDLSPLASLKHLESINANFTKVTKLPMSRMASLKELSVMSTPLDDEQAAAFAKLNPQCNFKHRYLDVLHHALDSATSIRVKTSGGCGENRKAMPLFAGDSAQELLAAIDVREPTEEMWIGCMDDIILLFYKDDKKLGEIEYFSRSGAMNFLDWPATVGVTPASKKRINALLFGGPQLAPTP